MNKVKIKIPAKVNFTLDVVGSQNGFHNLKSLVASISIWDTITLVKRSDDKVTLTCKGLPVDCPIEKNNAYKTAIAFVQKFQTQGVDITLEKKIPVGAGLGGSSADIAGVLLGMQKMFKDKTVVSDFALNELANQLGSDVAYMLNGGWAVISGKGDKITPVKTRSKFYLLILTSEEMISAGECYKKFDELNKTYIPATDKAVELLLQKDKWEFLARLKNDLYYSAKELSPQIEINLLALSKHGDAFMTGSGSATVGAYATLSERNKAYKQLKSQYGDKLIKAKTL